MELPGRYNKRLLDAVAPEIPVLLWNHAHHDRLLDIPPPGHWADVDLPMQEFVHTVHRLFKPVVDASISNIHAETHTGPGPLIIEVHLDPPDQAEAFIWTSEGLRVLESPQKMWWQEKIFLVPVNHYSRSNENHLRGKG